MTKQQQQTIFLAVAMAIVLVGAAYFLAVKPQLSERSDNNEERAVAEQTTTNLQAELVGLQAKEAALPEAEQQLRDLTSRFPNDYKQDEWFRMVLNVAAETGVEITSISPVEPSAPTIGDPNAAAQAVPPTPGAATVADDLLVAQSTVSIVATANAEEARAFISALEQMSRPLLIDAVQFSAAEGAQIVNITGKTFLSRGLEAPVTPEQAPIENGAESTP